MRIRVFTWVPLEDFWPDSVRPGSEPNQAKNTFGGGKDSCKKHTLLPEMALQGGVRNQAGSTLQGRTALPLLLEQFASIVAHQHALTSSARCHANLRLCDRPEGIVTPLPICHITRIREVRP